MSLVTRHTSFMHGIHMGSRGLGQAPPLRQSKNRSYSQGETSSLEEAANLDRIKWNSKPPSPPPPQIKDEAAQKRKRPIFSSLIGGRGGGYKFPIYFVQDCSLCNALIENKTRIALMAFPKISVQARRSRAMDEKKCCNVNRMNKRNL